MDLDRLAALVASWVLTYLLHSTVLLACVALVTRLAGSRRVALQEVLWRGAFLAGIATATAHVAGLWQPLPWAPVLDGSAAAAAADPAPVAPLAAVAAAPVAEARADARGWIGWLAAACGAVGVLGAASLGCRCLRLRRQLAGRRRLRRGPLSRELDGLRRRAGVRRRVRLSISAELTVPVATGLLRPEICLPARGFEALDADQRQAVLAHELAHLRGRDPLWLLAAHAVERLLWFQPWNRVARRQLARLAEYRCDDEAVGWIRQPLALASCLIEVAGWNAARCAAAPVPLPAMVSAPSQLEIRVRRVLDGATEPAGRRRAPRLLAALLCGAAAALPGFRFAPPDPVAEAPAIAAGSFDALARQLAHLADLQQQVTAELAVLRAEVAELGESEAWAAALELLEERTAALHGACARLRSDLITASPDRTEDERHER